MNDERGLQLVVPVGRELVEFEMRLGQLERLLRKEEIAGMGSGVSEMATFWLVALRGAELTTKTRRGQTGEPPMNADRVKSSRSGQDD